MKGVTKHQRDEKPKALEQRTSWNKGPKRGEQKHKIENKEEGGGQEKTPLSLCWRVRPVGGGWHKHSRAPTGAQPGAKGPEPTAAFEPQPTGSAPSAASRVAAGSPGTWLCHRAAPSPACPLGGPGTPSHPLQLCGAACSASPRAAPAQLRAARMAVCSPPHGLPLGRQQQAVCVWLAVTKGLAVLWVGTNRGVQVGNRVAEMPRVFALPILELEFCRCLEGCGGYPRLGGW